MPQNDNMTNKVNLFILANIKVYSLQRYEIKRLVKSRIENLEQREPHARLSSSHCSKKQIVRIRICPYICSVIFLLVIRNLLSLCIISLLFGKVLRQVQAGHVEQV